MNERESLKAGDYGVCYHCPARISNINGVSCDPSVFSTHSRSGGERNRPFHCPFPSSSSNNNQKEAEQALINHQLRQILNK